MSYRTVCCNAHIRLNRGEEGGQTFCPVCKETVYLEYPRGYIQHNHLITTTVDDPAWIKDEIDPENSIVYHSPVQRRTL